MTSHDVIGWLRRLLKEKKIGHGGTLDPNVAGVLPIAVGKATRLLEYILDGDKKYRCEMLLGLKTTTQDLEGEIIESKKVSMEQLKDLPSLIKEFTGEIEQIPPMTSALHYQGKRLYELAHQGKEVERLSRKVIIYQLKILQTSFAGQNCIIRFDVACSKGTYIRTLCNDLGQRLGSGGAMSFLIRTGTEGFKLADSFTLEDIKEMWEKGQKDFLLPMTGIISIPTIVIEDRFSDDIMMGKRIPIYSVDINSSFHNGQKVQIIDSKGIMAVGEVIAENQVFSLQPRKVLR